MARINRFLSLTNKIEELLYLYQPGSVLPSEQILSDRFDVTKPTLRRALKELEKNGLIRTKNGIGNIVIRHPETFSKEIIFLCDDMAFFADTLINFSTESAKHGYISSIVPLSGDSKMRDRIVQTVLERKPAGIILYSGPREKVGIQIPKNLPMLQLIRRQDDLHGDLLTFQNAAAETKVVRQFYAEGCRKFALYGLGEINPSAAEERRKGFLEGMKMVRLTVRERNHLPPGSSKEQQEAFFRLFADPKKAPDAVCCLNDNCAGNFFMEMKKRGISVENLHVSGFDASHFTAFFPIPILSVEPPLAELGRRAVELLTRRIENRGLAKVNETLKSKLKYMKKEE